MREYYQYIENIRSGKIKSSIYIKQQVERLEAMKQREDIFFDEKEVQRCFDFMAMLKEFQGAAAGKSGALLPFQKWIVGSYIGIKWKDTGLRVARDIFIMVARKNAKTSLIAKLSLYLLLCDGEESALIGNVASSRDQARILFEAAQQYAKTIDPNGDVMKHYRNYLKVPTTNNELKVFSSDSSNMDGYRFSPIAIADEVHSYKDNGLIAVLRSSFGASKQSCLFQITTAGFLLEGYPCFETYKMSMEILAGVKQQDSFFPFLYILDPDDDWEDEENWEKCNPSIDVVVSRDYLRQQRELAKNDKTQETAIKTKNFNLFCQSSQVWIPQTEIVKCMQPVNLEDFAGCSAYMGVDLSSTNDMTALSVMIPKDGKYYFKTFTFLPNDVLQNHPNKELYRHFKEEGSLTLTPGNIVDYDYIINMIAKLNELLYIQGIYYDSWNSTQFAITCTELGYNMVPYSQSLGQFNQPTREFERLVGGNLAVIDKSSMFLWSCNNVIIKQDWNGNGKPSKENKNKKIDAVITALEALGGYLKNPVDDFTITII